ncbi:MAG: protein kinase [Sandaracinaceae bacterium]
MSRPEPSPGDVVGKYVIESVLGRGGMGAVFRARHQITDRTVALKWLLEDDESRRRRFLREAKAMGRLSHPNVVGVLDVGDHEGAIYLVMDFVEGESLRDHMDEQTFAPADADFLMLPGMSGVGGASGRHPPP